MKKNLSVMITSILIVSFSTGSLFAQRALPHVPITYSGDTDETITRRAQWVDKAKREGEVVWWDSYNAEVFNKIASEFSKVYPFLKLTFWRGQEPERNARFETENASSRLSVDLVGTGDVTLPRWRSIGLLEKYTDIIPGIESMDKRMYSKFGDYAQAGNNATTMMYNTKLVSDAEAPKDWEDLLHPKWKGHIGLTKSMRTWYTLALADGGWGIEKTESFLRALKRQQFIWAPGVSAGFNLLLAGEYKIMGESFIRYTFDPRRKDAPIKWVRANPIPVTGGVFVLAKKAPHPHAARLFIEWLFSPQGLLFYENTTGYGAANPGSGTRLSKALDGVPLVYRTEEVVLKAAELRLDDRFSRVLGIVPE